MRIVRLVLLAGLLAIASLGLTTTGVAAYGHADGPLAQIEFSANCNNPGFLLCQQVGLGGIWLWIEIDSDTGVLHDGGDADVAGAGCGHAPGVGGSAESIRGEFEWTWSQFPQGFPGAFLALDPNGYYNVAFGFSFPVTVGHYSLHPAPGVAIELTVAP